MPYLFSSESVSEGHPDKISDQISDALVDYFLAFDPDSKVACETLVTTGQVFLAGEVNTQVYLDLEQIARDVINDIGYTKESYKFNGDSCGVLSAIHGQSPDINRGVDKGSDSKDFETLAKLQGAGDQGMMFGYANTETEDLIPLPLYLAHLLMKELADIRKGGKEMTYLRPDSKSQVTIEYSDDHKPLKIDTIVISTQHDEFDADDDKMQAQIRKDVQEILIPRVIAKLPAETQKLFADNYKLHVNPTGKFVIGGPHGDTGLTGRKIIVDTYGGRGAHGGGAFSGKDPSKVDRSGAYAARHIAKNLVAAGVADEVLVQVSYAIGRPEPCNLYIDTFNRSHVEMSDGEIAKKVEDLFDLRPYAIEQSLKLRNPIYRATAAYGHMGRKPYKKDLTIAHGKHRKEFKDLEFFTWEKLDRVDDIKKAFNL